MAIINRVPRGLLSLLDAKTLGRTPPDFGSEVRPTLDLGENYRADLPFQVANAVQVNGTGPTVGRQATVEVPPGEAWIIYQVEARCIIQNPTQTIVPGVVFVPETQLAFEIFLAAEISQNANQLIGAATVSTYTAPFPWIANPGARFGVAPVSGNKGGFPTSDTITVLYRRLVV